MLKYLVYKDDIDMECIIVFDYLIRHDNMARILLGTDFKSKVIAAGVIVSYENEGEIILTFMGESITLGVQSRGMIDRELFYKRSEGI